MHAKVSQPRQTTGSRVVCVCMCVSSGVPARTRGPGMAELSGEISDWSFRGLSVTSNDLAGAEDATLC